MEADKKYALLDTDFLYKTHLARNSDGRTLAELVPVWKVFDDIYDGKFQLMRNGDLQYIV